MRKTRFFFFIGVLARKLCTRGSLTDVVYLACGWPIAPSYVSPNAGGGGNGGVSANEYSCTHGAQINFGDLTPYWMLLVNTRKSTSLITQIRLIRRVFDTGDPSSFFCAFSLVFRCSLYRTSVFLTMPFLISSQRIEYFLFLFPLISFLESRIFSLSITFQYSGLFEQLTCQHPEGSNQGLAL